jgi:hypothetical protein
MKTRRQRNHMAYIFLFTIGTLLAVWQAPAFAASHSDAPLIKQDP